MENPVSDLEKQVADLARSLRSVELRVAALEEAAAPALQVPLAALDPAVREAAVPSPVTEPAVPSLVSLAGRCLFVLAGAFLGLAPNTQAQPPAAEAPNARAWAPGVADKKGRVINPIFRKEKDRVAPIDRGVDPDAVSPTTSKQPLAPTPPPVVVTPNPSKGSSGR